MITEIISLIIGAGIGIIIYLLITKKKVSKEEEK